MKYRTISLPFLTTLVLIAAASCGETSPAPKPDAMTAPSAKTDAATPAVLRDASPDKTSPPERQSDTAAVAPDVFDRDTPQIIDASAGSDAAVIADIKPANFADTTIDSIKQDSGQLSDTPVANLDSPRAIDSPSDSADVVTREPDAAFDQQIDTVSPDTKDAGCVEGSTRTTYSGPANTSGVGVCRPRVEKCGPTGAYMIETEEILPKTEIPWDGIDQDCNGSDPQCPVYVSADTMDAGIETGAPTSPWRTIQAAFDHSTACDTVIVKRGTYRDPVSCDGCEYRANCGIKTVKSEEGAAVTIIDLGNSEDKRNGFALDKCSLTIEGFTIANAYDMGIFIYSASITTVIQHNILLHNNTGIVFIYGPGNGGSVIIRNNIIIGKPEKTTGAYSGTAIELRQSGGVRHVENNLIIQSQGTSTTSAGIFIDNWSTGYVENNIIMNGYNGILRYYDYNTTTSRYNCLFGNSYNYVKYELAGSGDVTADPKLVGPISSDTAATADFHLSADSPCRNAGNPDPAYNDVDGTRNDIGPYGGPFGKW